MTEDLPDTATLKVAQEEGGEWFRLRIHSLEMPDGTQWDVKNGWRDIPPRKAE